MLQMQAIGHLGRDAQVNQVNGQTVINFALAHSEKFKKDGVEINKTIWVDCSWWTDRTSVAQYLKTGTQVHAAGTPDVDTYKTKDGQTVAKLRLRVHAVQLLGSKKDEAPAAQENGQHSNQGQQQQQPSEITQPVDDLPF